MTQRERQEQRAVLERLRRDARVLAERFGLPLCSVDAEAPRVRRRYGICYDDGSIRVRLRHARTRRLLKYSALIDTLCHELAHLRHFNHGARFQGLYRRILDYARARAIYQPAPRGMALPAAPPPAPRPVQLDLFDWSARRWRPSSRAGPAVPGRAPQTQARTRS